MGKHGTSVDRYETVQCGVFDVCETLSDGRTMSVMRSAYSEERGLQTYDMREMQA